MSKPSAAPSAQKVRRERVFTTRTLYLDASKKKKLFVATTYNFEDSNGEEYLIRIKKWNENSDEKGVHRLVFVSGSDPHVPIYRSRLHTGDDASDVFLSPTVHAGSRIVYTSYQNNDNVAVTRVSRGIFPDSEQRNHYSRSELADELQAFGLHIVEKPKKTTLAKGEHGRRGDLPSVGAVVTSTPNKPEPSTSRPRPESGSQPKKPSTSTPTKSFFSQKVMDGIRKKLSQNPVCVDIDESGLTMVSRNKTEIDELLYDMLSDKDRNDIESDGYECATMGSPSPGRILVFDDKKLTSYQLYEGVILNRVPTCVYTSVRMVLRAS